MATTTAAAIRLSMINLVEAIVPATHSGQRFVQHRQQDEFRTAMGAKPSACLRRFSVRYAGSTTAPAVNDTLVQEVTDTFTIDVAYPTDGRFGANHLTALDDAIADDARLIERYVGPPGYATLAGLVAPCTVLWEQDNEREVDGPVTFLRLTYRVDYFRSLS
jgi:hypothetical protein